MSQSENPYSAPATFETVEDPFESQSLPKPSVGKVLLKWLGICSVAAAPSFFIGLSFAGRHPSAICGMICGVLLFVLGYSVLEFVPQIQRTMQLPFARRSAWIGYGSRIAISIIFPIGLFLDIACGLMSVGLATQITGSGSLNRSTSNSYEGVDVLTNFFEFLLTTVVQGILLNLVLFAYMLLVYGICWMIASFRDRPTPEIP